MSTELRFIERSVPAPELGEGIGRMKKILQYRAAQNTYVPSVSEAPNWHGRSLQGNYGQLETTWGQWKDVPLVKQP